jgi:hypothetical protein
MVDSGCYHDLNWLTTIGESLKCLLLFLLAGIAGNGPAKVVIENQVFETIACHLLWQSGKDFLTEKSFFLFCGRRHH